MGRLLLRDTTVVDARDGGCRPHTDVLIEDDVIVTVQDSRPDAFAGEATVVEATGRWLAPGFNDLHAHPLGAGDPTGSLRLMLTYGVTGYRQMSGSTELVQQREAGAFEADDRPRLLALPGALLSPLNAADDATVRATVRAQAEQGADFVKMAQVEADVYPAAQEEANRLGIPLGGHLPTQTDVRDAARAGIRFVEHLGPGLGLLAS